ncbi:MAG: hypothetical protein ABSE08_01850 [Syntrophobacteraceae bacterium]
MPKILQIQLQAPPGFIDRGHAHSLRLGGAGINVALRPHSLARVTEALGAGHL